MKSSQFQNMINAWSVTDLKKKQLKTNDKFEQGNKNKYLFHFKALTQHIVFLKNLKKLS